jgi:hypothetical protein
MDKCTGAGELHRNNTAKLKVRELSFHEVRCLSSTLKMESRHNMFYLFDIYRAFIADANAVVGQLKCISHSYRLQISLKCVNSQIQIRISL